jgi:hypothetical protein
MFAKYANKVEKADLPKSTTNRPSNGHIATDSRKVTRISNLCDQAPNNCNITVQGAIEASTVDLQH